MSRSLVDNEHICLHRLSSSVQRQLDELAGRFTFAGAIEPLGPQKPGVDSTTKGILRDTRGRPAAVIICSRPAAPHLVARGVGNMEKIRAMLGPRLGAVILSPFAFGYVEGLSYMILPWRRPLSSSYTAWLFQRLLLRRQIMRWLHAAVREARGFHLANGTQTDFATPLRHIRTLPFLDREIHQAADLALDRLESGAWQPVHTFDHNDLWRGNVLLTPPEERTAGDYGFVLIDWSGANPNGFGAYDLLRFAHSFRLTTESLARHLLQHGAALDCDNPADIRSCLLAGIGRLHMHMEHFPLPRYIATVTSCWRACLSSLAWTGIHT